MALLRSESYKSGVIFSSVFNVLGKLMAFVQQWMIVYYFGSSLSTDLFFFTYNIVLYVGFFFQNFTTSVLVPEGVKIRVAEGDGRSQQFLNSYMFLFGWVSLGVLLVGMSNVHGIFYHLSSYSTEVVDANIAMICWCLPILLLNVVVSVMTEILVSYKYFTMPYMVSLVNYILGVLFVIFFHDRWGLDSVAIGLIVGYVANIFIVGIFMKRELHWSFFTRYEFRFRSILRSGLFSQLGQVVYLVSLYVPQMIFTSFPEGTLTAVNFADKILFIPAIFLVAQITSVMSVKVYNLVAIGDKVELSRLIERIMVLVTLGLLLCAVFISFLSEWMIDLIFYFGNYDASSKEITSHVLSLVIFYLPFSFMFSFYTKVFNAFKKQDLLFYLQLGSWGLMIVMYLMVIPEFGLYSYPLCRIAPAMLVGILCPIVLHRFFPELHSSRLIFYTVVAIIMTAICFLIVY